MELKSRSSKFFGVGKFWGQATLFNSRSSTAWVPQISAKAARSSRGAEPCADVIIGVPAETTSDLRPGDNTAFSGPVCIGFKLGSTKPKLADKMNYLPNSEGVP